MGDEYTPLGKYQNSKAKIRFKHQKCNGCFSMRPNDFLCGCRCPKCSHNRNYIGQKTDAEFKKEVKQLVGNEYTFLGHYKYARMKMLVRHNTCGHTYLVKPNNFLNGRRCAYCAGNRKLTYGELKKKVEQIAPEYKLVERGGKKAEFLHKSCGNVFEMDYSTFVQGQRCPKCSFALAHKKHMISNEEFLKRVSLMKSNRCQPLEKYRGMKNKIKFKCLRCHYIFSTAPQDFLRSTYACQICANKARNKFKTKSTEQFENELFKVFGNELTLVSQYKKDYLKVKIKCNKCDRIFEATPSNLLRGKGCPFCKASHGEKCVRKYLKEKDILFEEQFKIKKCKDQNELPFDFAVFNADRSLNCLIEYQGAQHFVDPFSYQNQWFSKESVLNTQKHDAMKLQYCKDHGIKLIRINHPQTSSKSNSIEFIKRLVNRTLNKELHVV